MDINSIPVGTKFNLDDVFANLPTETEELVELPSKSKFYNSQKIVIRPMTFEDEKCMVMARKNKEDAINTILARCVQGVHPQDLLMMDKLYLILKLRSISYGDTYSATVTCAKCSADNNLNFKLSDLPVQYIDDFITEFREIQLPITKVMVKIRIPRVSDEKFLTDEVKIFDNIWRFVETINGSDDKVLISKFLKDPRVPLKDMHTITNAIALTEYGIQTKVRFDCDSCNYANVIGLPLGADFFTVN